MNGWPFVNEGPVQRDPGVVGISNIDHLVAAGILVLDGCQLLGLLWSGVEFLPRAIRGARKGIDRDVPQVTGVNQSLQAFGIKPLIRQVLVNTRPQFIEIGTDHRFPRPDRRILHRRKGYGRENADNRHHDDQLDQRETRSTISDFRTTLQIYVAGGRGHS